ncbi:MAG: PilZ domain-containing protein [Haliea sp.]
MSDTGISDQEQIATLLGSIQRHQLLVHLLSASASGPEPSMLLAGSFRRRQLLFDAPRNLHAGAYQPGQVITAMTVRDGAELRFDTEILGIEDYRGYPALRTSWPRQLIHHQRRKAFRVRIGKDRSSRLDLYDDGGNRVRGRLLDLSASGFGALIERSASLRAGEEVASALEIGGVTLDLPVKVRDLKTPPLGRFIRIGAAFSGLTPQQQTQLEKLIRTIERQAIRVDGASSS